ncbi:MAG: aldo/keto reductase, partial [Proteobacteria bacterium]|nr:aldo/keto reductase [Pseudomonadota bacterium]
MEYRTLNPAGLAVSTVCLGTMMFGAQTSAAVAGRIVARARDGGVNFIDTADVYADGESELVVGRLIKRHRHDWVLATKFGASFQSGPNRQGVSRKRLIQQLDASLARLGTDFIDIYYIHLDDQITPLAETIRAMGDVIRQGKVRYFGISNFRGWRIAEVVRLCDTLGVDRPAACQPLYNAVSRYAEDEVLPACANYGIGVVAYSPLARGVLTAKYAPGKSAIKGSRAGRNDRRLLTTEFRDESLEIAQTISDHARSKGMSAAQFAFLWVLNNRLVASAIGGPRTLGQWDDYMKELRHTF